MMDLAAFKKYCMLKRGVRETFPFDDETLVFKVGSKMFALTNIKSENFSINLKCDPNIAIDLRNSYQAIKPGYHMNKEHWNTVICDGSLDESQLHWMIDMSYDLVFKSLKRSEKEAISSIMHNKEE